jgi:hypothetical protein
LRKRPSLPFKAISKQNFKQAMQEIVRIFRIRKILERESQIRRFRKENKIMKQKIEDIIKNIFLVETNKKSIKLQIYTKNQWRYEIGK